MHPASVYHAMARCRGHLTCGACAQLLVEPVILTTCHHTVCAACLDVQLAKRAECPCAGCRVPCYRNDSKPVPDTASLIRAFRALAVQLGTTLEECAPPRAAAAAPAPALPPPESELETAMSEELVLRPTRALDPPPPLQQRQSYSHGSSGGRRRGRHSSHGSSSGRRSLDDDSGDVCDTAARNDEVANALGSMANLDGYDSSAYFASQGTAGSRRSVARSSVGGAGSPPQSSGRQMHSRRRSSAAPAGKRACTRYRSRLVLLRR